MYSASFIFKPGTYDDEFHRLNKLINDIALGTQGYLGTESWYSKDGKTVNATYFWESLESLKVFSGHPTHLKAKRQYSRWYDGYHIVISQVLESYGDGTMEHFTPNHRNTKKP